MDEKPQLKWEDYEDCYLNVEKTEIEQLRKKLGDNVYMANYEGFRRSGYWKAVQKLVLERDHHKCTKCGYPNELHVHHHSYDRHGFEHANLQDLTTLCGICHKKAHGIV